MKKNVLIAIVVVLLLAVLVLGGYLIWNNQRLDKVQKRTGQTIEDLSQTSNEKNCVGEECLQVEDLEYPVGNLPTNVRAALDDAIEDEYKAYTTYDKVIEKFGSVRPFIMIIRAEEQHIASLKAIYDKYGLEIPANEWSDKITTPDTLKSACQTGVDAEIANAALYRDELLPVVEGYDDITAVFNNLMSASENNHLPAFDRCN